MSLTVLSVAYPFAPVRPDTPGGAEQVLATLDRKLVAAGHRSIVLAKKGSEVAGTLAPMPAESEMIDEAVRARVHRVYRSAVAELIDRGGIDVVHMHGLDFEAYLPPAGPPVLVTLHLPIAWYPQSSLQPSRQTVFFNCVSARQHCTAAGIPRLLAPIENGVDLEAYPKRCAKRGFALMLTRICPEKGVHLALEAAKRADCPLLIAGRVFPYAEHRRYFETEVWPRLDNRRRLIGQIGPDRKRRLLAAARCVLIASTVAETSSLVAREALAAGTPVIAYARGAFVDVIEDGKTGFLVRTAPEMAAAIGGAGEIDADACRAVARERFSDQRMFDAYLDLYTRLAAGEVATQECEAWL